MTDQNGSTIETLFLTPEQFEFIDRFSRGLNPDTPPAFGAPHAIRMLLERFEQAEIDLSDASSEGEIASLGAERLRRTRRR